MPVEGEKIFKTQEVDWNMGILSCWQGKFREDLDFQEAMEKPPHYKITVAQVVDDARR